MGKFLKQGKVVILLAGRFAGRKAIVVKTYDNGVDKREFGHALVAGIDRYPRPVTKVMGKKKIVKRSKVKPFVKFVNFQHLMPTRYSVDMDIKAVVLPSSMKVADKKVETKKELKKLFESKYLASGKPSTGMSWFFKKLRF
eukprot:TRINITY_DN798_c0_g1_i2.p2 TRINITY_DN798_c0_g1~~TRINITY_DN798_c0_g1_i2.p2  ORF type:complete len:141 (+),score=63.03 TRINITY_DN798_c0_g1_i2:39-461(+)